MILGEGRVVTARIDIRRLGGGHDTGVVAASKKEERGAKAAGGRARSLPRRCCPPPCGADQDVSVLKGVEEGVLRPRRPLVEQGGHGRRRTASASAHTLGLCRARASVRRRERTIIMCHYPPRHQPQPFLCLVCSLLSQLLTCRNVEWAFRTS